jgi:dienelactone hydrolase
MEDIRGLTGATARPSKGVQFVIEGFGASATEPVTLQGENGELHGSITVPATAGPHPAVLILSSTPSDTLTQMTPALAQSGHVVMVIGVTPNPPGAEGLKSPYLGTFNLLGLRALLVGKSIMGMRIDDTIRAMDLLAPRSDVDPASITVYGNSAMGAVALNAAVLDSRIKRVVVENTLTSYRLVLDEPLHRNISEILIPGVLRKYDMGDLLLALGGRVTVINPQNAAGEIITAEQFHRELSYVPADRVKLIFRKAEDPLPLD